jgi:hypothetical protein
MIAAGEPKAAVARTLRIGRTTLYRHLTTADQAAQTAASTATNGTATNANRCPRAWGPARHGPVLGPSHQNVEAA